MDWRNRISIDKEVCGGRPCIKGSRIPVKVVLDNLAAGESHLQIISGYPTLKDEDIMACLAFAAELASDDFIELQASPA